MAKQKEKIERIRDLLKKMISCPLQNTGLDSTQLYNTHINTIINDTHYSPRDTLISKCKHKNKSTGISKFQINLSSNKNNTIITHVNTKTSKCGKLKKYDRFSLFKYLLERKQNNLHHLKPELSFGQLICLAILQSDQKKLILSEICRWISNNFPFYKLNETNWQNSIRHTLSVNPNFIKLETIKVSDNKINKQNNKNTKKQYVFVGKDNNGLNKINQNIKKSSNWGVLPGGESSFFICSPDDIHLFIGMVRKISTLLSKDIYVMNDSYTDSLTFQDPQLIGSNHSDSSSPFSQVSNSSIPLSNTSSVTDLTTLSFDNTQKLSLPFSLTPPADNPPIQILEEIEPQQDTIYDLDAKLDLLKTPKFDTSPVKNYILNSFENDLENTTTTTNNNNNCNSTITTNQYDVNKVSNDVVLPFFTNLNPLSPTLILNESILNFSEDNFFSSL